ncbi:MAG TPA: hypothetical protein VLA12_24245 [Planctomycetaceae bacterium]|nr:hypothetical protein [Planctomycetaceae bacterium]
MKAELRVNVKCPNPNDKAKAFKLEAATQRRLPAQSLKPNRASDRGNAVRTPNTNRLQASATTSHRATSNSETSENPNNFPNYLKTVQNSWISSKDPKDGKMCSFKFPTFEIYWTYVKKSAGLVKQAEGELNVVIRKSKDIRNQKTERIRDYILNPNSYILAAPPRNIEP